MQRCYSSCFIPDTVGTVAHLRSANNGVVSSGFCWPLRPGNFIDIVGSVSAQSGDTLAMEGRCAEIGFVEARALEPQVYIVLPGEADAAVHQHCAIGATHVNV